MDAVQVCFFFGRIHMIVIPKEGVTGYQLLNNNYNKATKERS